MGEVSFFLQLRSQPPRVEVPVDGWQLLQLLHHIVKHAKSLRTRQQVLVTVEILTRHLSDQGFVLKEQLPEPLPIISKKGACCFSVLRIWIRMYFGPP
jgi:hypothetical protein